MESYEVMKKAVNTMGAKYIASEMNLSSSLIYKWCQAKDETDSCGTDNPLDRIARICHLTQETEPIEWLCAQANGYFVKNPCVEAHDEVRPITATQKILEEFSELLDVVAKSIADDQVIDRNEGKRIRAVWETLKSATESFVVACENGSYSQKMSHDK